MLTVRLDSELEEFLEQYSESHALSKSSIVREALTLYFKEHNISANPYEIGSELFGQHGSGDQDRSSTYKRRLKRKFREKRSN